MVQTGLQYDNLFLFYEFLKCERQLLYLIKEKLVNILQRSRTTVLKQCFPQIHFIKLAARQFYRQNFTIQLLKFFIHIAI